MSAKTLNKPVRKKPVGDILQRFTDILAMIPTKPNSITAAEIQNRLTAQPSLRTVQRNLLELSRRHPIICDMSNKSLGWQWMENPVPQVAGVSMDMALTMKFVTAYIADLLPQTVRKNIQRMSDAANKALSTAGASQLAAWPEKVRILHKGPARTPPVISSTIQEEFYRALLTGQQLRISYASAGNTEAKTSIVSPLGLVSKEGLLYLVVAKNEDKPVYVLAAHRIQEAEVLALVGIRPETWRGLDQYINDGNFAYPPGPRILNERVTLRVINRTAQNLKEMPFTGKQNVVDDGDGYCRISATMTLSEELVRWLLQFGSSVEVIEPASLRAQMKAAAEDLVGLYAAET
jgi:predicted DNA-binding transcriptional regulator YafY